MMMRIDDLELGLGDRFVHLIEPLAFQHVQTLVIGCTTRLGWFLRSAAPALTLADQCRSTSSIRVLRLIARAPPRFLEVLVRRKKWLWIIGGGVVLIVLGTVVAP